MRPCVQVGCKRTWRFASGGSITISSRGRPTGKSGDRHGWNSLDHYLTIHERHLDELYESGVIVDDDLAIVINDQAGTIRIEGRVHCGHGLLLVVRKMLEINWANQCRTFDYSYHAMIERSGLRPIFRYDNSPHSYPGHLDYHHKHRFDPLTGMEQRPPIWVRYEGWPYLSEVIVELWEWWQHTGQFLSWNDAPPIEDD